jgi:hypothetical protein
MGTAETAACPLCGQSLTTDHRDAMLVDLESERGALLARFQAAQDESRGFAERRKALEAEDAALAGERCALGMLVSDRQPRPRRWSPRANGPPRNRLP